MMSEKDGQNNEHSGLNKSVDYPYIIIDLPNEELKMKNRSENVCENHSVGDERSQSEVENQSTEEETPLNECNVPVIEDGDTTAEDMEQVTLNENRLKESDHEGENGNYLTEKKSPKEHNHCAKEGIVLSSKYPPATLPATILETKAMSSQETKETENHLTVDDHLPADGEHHARRRSSIYVTVPEEEIPDDWDDEEKEDGEGGRVNPLAVVVVAVQTAVILPVRYLREKTKGYLFTSIFLVLFTAYFIAAMVYEFGDEGSIRLLVCTILGIIIYTRSYIAKGLRIVFLVLGLNRISPSTVMWLRFGTRCFLYLALAAVVVYTIVDNVNSVDDAQPLIGLVIFFLCCLFLSTAPRKINWHTVIWGIGLQFVFAMCTIKYRFGQDAIHFLQDRLNEFYGNSQPASTLLFGPKTSAHQLLFESLPLVFVVSSALAILYYVGAMQFVIRVIGTLFSFIMDTQPAESMTVAAGIFLDSTTAALAVRPYLGYQSKSQLFMIVTSCFASLGATYLAILGSNHISIEFILPAMLISAPATFAVCKLIMPESRPVESKRNKMDAVDEDTEVATNMIDAFQAGAMIALPLLANIIAIAFAFLSAISWLNHTFQWLGDRVGKHDLTMEYIFSYLMYPLALAMGIHPSECRLAGRFLGIRVISSNFIAFLQMLPLKFYRFAVEANECIGMAYGLNETVKHVNGKMFLVTLNMTVAEDDIITERTEMILTFGLCGFSSVLAMAFVVAVFYALLPKRRLWLSEISILALLAGNIANCMTACFASLFYSGDAVLSCPEKIEQFQALGKTLQALAQQQN